MQDDLTKGAPPLILVRTNKRCSAYLIINIANITSNIHQVKSVPNTYRFLLQNELNQEILG